MTRRREREEVLNTRLGELLVARHPAWNGENVIVESTQAVADHPGWKIDILVAATGQPVAIEAKRAGGRAEDLNAQIGERMGKSVDPTGDVIESGISLLYAEGQKASSLEGSEFRYAIHQWDGTSVSRWPEEDWLTGTIDDLASQIETISLSARRLKEGEETLARGVGEVSAQMSRDAEDGTLRGIGDVLHQESCEQTTRMAVAIIVNAFVFHYAVEGISKLPLVDTGRGKRGFLKSKVLDVWAQILKINYWPIFSIARDILQTIPTRLANTLLTKANDVAEELVNIGAAAFHDLAGRMLQTLITDRKFLATFYTLPTSAALLAELAIDRLDVDWSDASAIGALKLADFACGTGALLAAAQRSIYRRHRRSGGDDRHIHRWVMENVLLGTDIMPVATHLTASMLSSAHPGVGYGHSLVQVLPYGLDAALARHQRRPEDTVYIGALDFLGHEFADGLLGDQGIELVGGRRMRVREGDNTTKLSVPHNSLDMVIMNPPFTRPNANRPRADVGIPIPSFAGFDTSGGEQENMAKKLRAYPKRFSFGHAGLASNFMDLADVKLKPGGVLGLVLPLTFTSGHAWKRARSSLEQRYRDIDVLSIAREGSENGAFSADTGIAECIVVAKKRYDGARGRNTVGYFNLPHRPGSLVESNVMAANIARRQNVLNGSLGDFGLARLVHGSVAEAMLGLVNGELVLPRSRPHALGVRVVTVGYLAGQGLDHQMARGRIQKGPFVLRPMRQHATYPALWGHHAGAKDGDRERCLDVHPDARGEVKPGREMRERALYIWERMASRLHVNYDFRLNSQSLAMCLTPTPAIGGRAWPSLFPRNDRYTLPMLLWANSTLGLVTFWWHGNRQQDGRANLTLSKLPTLPIIDAANLTEDQVELCCDVYERLRTKPFLPANEAYRDPVRKELDIALFHMLELPESLLPGLDTLRTQWCAEPSVHGGKTTRP